MMISRHELNESEASFLWAVAHFGGGESLLNFLQPGAQNVLRPKLKALAKLDADARAEVLQKWASEDEISCEDYAKTRWVSGELWREASNFSLQKLSLLSPRELPARMLQIGLFQFSVVVRGQDRREMIRTRRELGEGLMKFLDVCLSADRVVSKEEEVRIREVLIVLSRRFEEVEQRLGHLGMYFVACAAGTRFRRQVTRIAESLGGDLGRVFLWYYQSSLRSSREDLDEIAQFALDGLGVAVQRGTAR